MSLPIENARTLTQSMSTGQIRNLIAQAKAKQVLREVHEIPANFPDFTRDLDDRVTFIAYALLAAGCSLIEQGEVREGQIELQAAADILESAHRTETANQPASALHCLIGAMAFYACGQYSRAFVLMSEVEQLAPAGRIIASFLRKDRAELIARLNDVLLATQPTFEEQRQFDDWAIAICVARSVAMAFDHTISGDPELLVRADAILVDAMIISEGSSDPPSWWIARLLRLMLTDYEKGSLWSVLPPFFEPNGIAQIDGYVKQLALLSPPVIELWQSQISALGLALNPENLGGVINLRTSAGKTRVAELAILQALRANPTAKVLYLAPFRSLAFELERTFSSTLSPLGYSVSHLYGGSRFSVVDKELMNDGRITIATPEKAKAMLRADPELFNDVKLVVIDEGHLLGGNERDVRNEVFYEFLRLLARKNGARILLLSAVLPNAADLAYWLGGNIDALARSDWKPSSERFGKLLWKQSAVSIEWLGGERCFNPHFIEFKEVPKISQTGKVTSRVFPQTKVEAVAATAVRLSELGPVLIYAGQAQWVPSMVRNVLLALGDTVPDHPWPETEWRIFEAVCKEELGDHSLEVTAARLGVICHSNRLPPQVRISLEKLMAKAPSKIIVATTTLGQRVNFGISSVIVSTTFIGENLQISTRDFWNICGRAGRAFVDAEGKILFAIDATRREWNIRNDEAIAARYMNIGRLNEVESGLRKLVKDLQQFAETAGVSFEVFLELVANDSFDRCGPQKENIKERLDWIDDQLLALHVAYKGDDSVVDWVDDAFRDSLAAIQERSEDDLNSYEKLLAFLTSRVSGVLLKVPSPNGRRAIVASGLPLSVGVLAFEQLDSFREMIDRYLSADAEEETRFDSLVLEFEVWARVNAQSIVKDMPEPEKLKEIRAHWLSGLPLKQITDACGPESGEICNDLYGYQLPWLLNSIAQKLDKETEEARIYVLAKAALLVELGLPTEAAAKVFLAGVRSRTSAVELSRVLADPSESISRVREILLDPVTVKVASSFASGSSLDWLHLLSKDNVSAVRPSPKCSRFSLKVPEDIKTLYARQLEPNGTTFLTSIDARFKFAVKVTEQLPFDRFANDPRFVFVRDGDAWLQQSRDASA